jgi:hypothetical protein
MSMLVALPFLLHIGLWLMRLRCMVVCSPRRCALVSAIMKAIVENHSHVIAIAL